MTKKKLRRRIQRLEEELTEARFSNIPVFSTGRVLLGDTGHITRVIEFPVLCEEAPTIDLPSMGYVVRWSPS